MDDSLMRRLPVIALLACVNVRGHDVITTKVTWTREISRIVYRRCASCHRPGGAAFSLMSYEEARPWAVAIKEEVLERRMPPWSAVKGFGDFRNDAGLSNEEIELMTDWIVGGAPAGDANLAPPILKFTREKALTSRPGSSLAITGNTVLKRESTVAAIRPDKLAQGATLRIVAERPDGSIEPLIWLYNYQPRFTQTYYLRRPLRLPAGTRIRMEPDAAGTISLMMKPSTAAAKQAH